MANEVLDLVTAKLPEGCPKIAREMALLSKFYFLPLEANSDAERYLLRALTIQELEIPDNWRTFETKSLLGQALVAQKKYGQAELLLEAGYEGLIERELNIPPIKRSCIAEAAQRLVVLYESMDEDIPDAGYADKAAEWQERLEEATSKLFGELPDE